MDKEKKYLIYSYIIGDSVYVGLTKNLERRDAEHRYIKYKKKDSLKNYITEHNLELPLPEILETDLNETEAILKENNWINFYKSNGFNIINKGKTGLGSGSIGNVTLDKKPKKKCGLAEIEDKLNSNTLSDDDAISCFWRFRTKTSMSKEFPKLYDFCRERNLLIYFPKKKRKEKIKLKYSKLIHLDIIDWGNCSEIPSAPGFYIDKDSNVYIKCKKNAKKLETLYDEDGYKKCTLRKNSIVKEVYYHNIIAEVNGFKKNYVVRYKDNDIKNIKPENIEIIEIDKGCISKTFLDNTLITKYGDVINEKRNTYFNLEKRETGYFVNDIDVAYLIYNYFVRMIDFNDVKVLHLNDDVYDNRSENLIVEDLLSDVRLRISSDGKNMFNLNLIDGKNKILIERFSHKVYAKKTMNLINSLLEKNRNYLEWLGDIRLNEVAEIKSDDIKLSMNEMRLESSGCYWFEPRKCWKSKIYHNDKEWSLGYFDNFDDGKLMYEIASLYIKYNKFDSFMKNIVTERESIKGSL